MPDAIKTWREQVGRDLLKLDFRPCGTAPFRAAMRPILMTDEVKVVVHSHSPGFTYRDKDMVKDGQHSQSIVMPLCRQLRFAHCGRSGKLDPGDATLLSHCDPGEVGAPHAVSFVAILTRGERAHTGDLLGRPWSRTSSTCLRLLGHYISLLAREGVSSHEASGAAGRHIADLLVHAAEECRSARPAPASAASVQDVRLASARAFIAQNYRDPGLSLALVAARQGISTRYLQQLFEQAGLRFAAQVNEMRLAEVARLLAETGGDSASILDIALAAGFSDISNFNRQFKRHFGVTPSAMRQHLVRQRVLAH